MKFTARKLVVICAIQICFLGSLKAQEFAKPLETYQIESQYGPEIAVLNPIFPKDGKLELNLGVNYSPVSSLYNFYGASAGLTYHFNRRHAIEPIWAQYNFGELSSFAEDEIRNKLNSTQNGILGVDMPRLIVSSSYIFTPFYSKMHLTDMSVMHMDIYTVLGVAGVQTEQFLLNGNTGDSNWRFGGTLGFGVRILMRSRFGARIELKDFIHPAKNIGANELVNDLQRSAGLSIFFDAFPDYTQM